MRCKDKVVLVTGGSRGIGRAICLRLAEEGAKVAVNYMGSPDQAAEVVNAIQAGGGEAIAIKADVGLKIEIDGMVDEALRHFGRIDGLVNNAGICIFSEVLDITEELWDHTMNVNLKGTFLCSQAVSKRMVSQGSGGSIVSISSINHFAGGKLQAHYGVTKSGQVNLMKSFALGLAPYRIRCNSVLPGTIATDMNKDYLDVKENNDYLVNRIPAGRIGDPVDIAHAVVYLISDESNYVNGTEFLIDGGSLVNFL
ncbi:MAG: glucose 1-dehydrogenase [Paenibacillaceae bacterium]